jgi:hypothetical protein
MTEERACLLIADISGYTSYLSGVELDHAQDILADLLVAVATPLRPAFAVAKLEGDAVFMVSPVTEIDGSVLLDLLESSYFGFRRRLRSIQQASACACDACRRIPALDLKLVVHHGTVIRHEVLGSQELVGADVIVVHRLLKNRIAEDLGVTAYALLTDACLAETGLDPAGLALARYEDELEDIGVVGGWVHDLHRAFVREQDRHPVRVEPDEALWSSETAVPGVPVSLAWEWLTTPARKISWEVGFDRVWETPGDGGRRGVGTRTHCMHGENRIDMEVLDWRPPHHVTSTGSFPDGSRFVVTDEVEPDGDGVVLRKRLRAASEEDRAPLAAVLEMVGPLMDQWLPTLAGMLVEAAAAAGVDEALLPEPDEARRLATARHD